MTSPSLVDRNGKRKSSSSTPLNEEDSFVAFNSAATTDDDDGSSVPMEGISNINAISSNNRKKRPIQSSDGSEIDNETDLTDVRRDPQQPDDESEDDED